MQQETIQIQHVRSRLWQALSSNGLLIGWLSLITLALAIGLWFPQAPIGSQDGADGIQAWLARERAELGGATDVLYGLGFLTVAVAPWMRLILGGLAVTLILGLYDSAGHLFSPPTLPQDTPLETIRVELPAQTALKSIAEAVQEYLGRGYRAHLHEDDREAKLLIWRPVGTAGELLFRAGLLAAIAGWLWTQAAGWQMDAVRLTEGMTAELLSGSSISLLSLDVRGETGDPTANCSIEVQEADAVGRESATWDRTWRWKGTIYALSGIGPAAQVRGTNQTAEQVTFQLAAGMEPIETVHLLLPPETGPRTFAAPDIGLVVQLEADSAEDGLRVRLRAYEGREGGLIADRILDQDTRLALNGADLEIEIHPYAQLTVTHAPGSHLVWGGLLAACLGLLFALLIRRPVFEVSALPEEGGARLAARTAHARDQGSLAQLLEVADNPETGEGVGESD